jgi:Ca2+-dependent lipid-binding protein
MRVKKNQSKKQSSKSTPKKQGAVEQMPELVFNPMSTENTPTVSEEITTDAVVANEPIAEATAPLSKTIEQQNAEKANELEAGNVTINRLPMDEVAKALVQVDEDELDFYEEVTTAEQPETAVEVIAEYAKESLDKYTDEQLTGILKVMIDFDLQTAFLGLRGSEVFLYSIPQEDCGVITIEEVKDRLNLPQNEE